MGACKDTNKYEIVKKFWYFRNNTYFCNPNPIGHIPAVVVKWYTRYFEGVVGDSPCEFDSHLPHRNRLQNRSEAGFVFSGLRQVFAIYTVVIEDTG